MAVNSRTLHVHCEWVELAVSAPSGIPLNAATVHLFYATLEQLRPQLAAYRSLLDAEEVARAKRFLHEQDRERFIVGHGLLRKMLGLQLGVAPEQIHFRRGEFGKPFIEGDPVHFNLSDTKDAVLVALADRPIGADIETMNRNTDHERVAAHYFTKPEVESIKNAQDGKRRFLELWTRKEAVLKACGVGLMDDLHSLNVGDAFNEMTISHPDFVRMAGAEYHVRTAYVGRDHLVSLAAERSFATCLFAA